MSLCKFSWPGDDAATGGVGALLHDLGDEGEGDRKMVTVVNSVGMSVRRTVMSMSSAGRLTSIQMMD